MWRNYLAVGFRTLTKQRAYAFINIFGLALGFAACLILLLYVRYEATYDQWLPGADRVYQVQTLGTDPAIGENLDMRAATRPVAAALAAGFPRELDAVARFEPDEHVVLMDGRPLAVAGAAMADPSFFHIMQIPFLRGERATALSAADSVTLSRSEAMRLFGSIDVVGRTLTTMRDGAPRDLRVTGVFEDLPGNTHMAFSMVRRFNSAEEFDCSWGCVNGFVYARVRPGASADAVNARMPAWERRHVPPTDISGRDIGAAFDWRLVNVRDIHLGTAQDNRRPGNDVRTLVTFSVIALLILGIACVNFVNLATARASQRAREVAVRKVLGAARGQLVTQFLGESLLLVGIAMLAALAMAELILPTFADFLGADLNLTYFGAGGMVLPILALVSAVGLAGGLYPALYLSRYKPAAVLKGGRSSAEPLGTGKLRSGLVIAQFSVSIALIVCTLVVYSQTVFVRTIDPGYQRDGLLIVDRINDPQVEPLSETLSREIARIEGVQGVAGTMMAPGTGRQLFKMARLPGRTAPVQLGFYSVEPAFFRTMRMEVLAGRTLSPDYANDNIRIDPALTGPAADAAIATTIARGFNIVVNETAARRLGFAAPQAAIGQQVSIPLGEDQSPSTATIVGVVRDARFRSLREPVEPIAYYDSGVYLWLAIRYDTAQPNLLRQRIERVWARLFPTVPFEAEYADARVAAFYIADEWRGRSFAGFSALAVAIACLGLFGLAAFTAERRTKEIGIRKVFGARTRDIVQLLVWQFTRPVVIANLIAWPVAWWAMREWLNTFDARVDLGPGPFLIAGLIALAIAIGTVAGHAVRIARANPIHALRYE